MTGYYWAVSIERYIGVDLAWAIDRSEASVNESGVVVIDGDGVILHAGWTKGLEHTIGWIEAAAAERDALVFIDAPLVVDNPHGQRHCETEVGRRYGRWCVSANSVNLASPHQAGVRLRERLAERGWTYHDGFG